MSEHYQQRAMKMVDGVLDAPESNRIGDVARGAYDEEIAENERKLADLTEIVDKFSRITGHSE